MFAAGLRSAQQLLVLRSLVTSSPFAGSESTTLRDNARPAGCACDVDLSAKRRLAALQLQPDLRSGLCVCVSCLFVCKPCQSNYLTSNNPPNLPMFVTFDKDAENNQTHRMLGHPAPCFKDTETNIPGSGQHSWEGILAEFWGGRLVGCWRDSSKIPRVAFSCSKPYLLDEKQMRFRRSIKGLRV